MKYSLLSAMLPGVLAQSNSYRPSGIHQGEDLDLDSFTSQQGDIRLHCEAQSTLYSLCHSMDADIACNVAQREEAEG